MTTKTAEERRADLLDGLLLATGEISTPVKSVTLAAQVLRSAGFVRSRGSRGPVPRDWEHRDLRAEIVGKGKDKVVILLTRKSS